MDFYYNLMLAQSVDCALTQGVRCPSRASTHGVMCHLHLSWLHVLSVSALLEHHCSRTRVVLFSKQHLHVLIGTALLCVIKQQMLAELAGWQTMIGLCAVVLTRPVCSCSIAYSFLAPVTQGNFAPADKMLSPFQLTCQCS